MTQREGLISTLNHQEPDHLCVDFGAGFQTGLGAGVSLDRNGLVGVNESVPRKHRRRDGGHYRFMN